MISYAQNFEDVMLARAFAGREHGFYIDVGAWHPTIDSVTKHFYDLGWHGINIEPVERYFRLLKSERGRDLNLHLALGAGRETRTLHCFEDSGLSTFSDQHLDEFASLGLRSNQVAVEVTTLRDVCDQHAREDIDFLKIDVEDWELPVIQGADWATFRPKIILVEAVAPNPRAFLASESEKARPAPSWSSWECLLLAHDFELCYFDGLNRFYVRREDLHLKSAFEVPPNVYDGFVPYQLVEAQAERDRLKEDLRHMKAVAAKTAAAAAPEAPLGR